LLACWTVLEYVPSMAPVLADASTVVVGQEHSFSLGNRPSRNSMGMPDPLMMPNKFLAMFIKKSDSSSAVWRMRVRLE